MVRYPPWYISGTAGIVRASQTSSSLSGTTTPSTEAGDDLRIEWAVTDTDKHGEIPTAKLTSDVTRINIAGDALDELKDAEYDGKEIVLTVRGNFSNAKIKATLRFAAPEREITKIVAGPAGTPDDVIKSAYWIDLYGHGLTVLADGDVTADAIKDGEPVHYAWKLAKVRVNEDEHIQLDYMGIDGGSTSFMADNNSEVTFTVNGVSRKAVFNPA